jgi:peptidoglycan-associated lipoprotein
MHGRRSLALIAAVLFASACRPKAQPETTPSTQPVADTAGQAAADSARMRAARESAERERERERAADAARAERERINAVMTAPIHFEFDRSDLSLEARANLDAKLVVLRANPAMRLRIEGHADERGAAEYNFALGMRRAAAARRYLMQRDVAGERLDTGSHGEERPVCEASTEDCWRRSRRAEFSVGS